MSSTSPTEEKVFHAVQKFLREPPVIIWGSGATVSYGLPSMSDFNEVLHSQLEEFDETANLEVKLGTVENQDKINEIRNIIRNEVVKQDTECLKKAIKNISYFEAINKMIDKFYNAHPQKIDIVTTNYDRVLEYALSMHRYNYTDGFTGRSLSQFDPSAFGTKQIINLIKVHGSLGWVTYKNSIFVLPCEYNIDEIEHVMILPSKKKYEDAYKEPYRTLITKSDEAIDAAKSFLVVGFGFNDEHLTPRIENKIKQGFPIVIIVKEATASCKSKLENSTDHVILEQDQRMTKVTLMENGQHWEMEIDENYWKLNNFMRILGS